MVIKYSIMKYEFNRVRAEVYVTYGYKKNYLNEIQHWFEY